MSLRIYSGEFLVSPVPLHMDLNYCSHGCYYCFANLNQPNRRFDPSFISSAVKAVSRDSEETKIEHWLLKAGYPILVSNTVDPFAASNVTQFHEVHRSLSKLGVRFTYQTKGGPGQEIAVDGDPTMIYISITSDSDDLLKSREPGAPSFEQRMALAEQAVKRGHFVVAGINPMHPDWWLNFPSFCGRLFEIGVTHCWIGALHLSYQQRDAMPASQQRRFADEIDEAMKRSPANAFRLLEMEQELHCAGLNVFTGERSSRGDFWAPYFELGFPWFPTLESFEAHCETQNPGQPVLFTAADFAQWASVGMPEPRAIYKEYVTHFARSVRNYNDSAREVHHKPRTLRQVVDAYFCIRDYPTRFRRDRFYVPGWRDSDGFVVAESASGEDMLAYWSGPESDLELDITNLQAQRLGKRG